MRAQAMTARPGRRWTAGAWRRILGKAGVCLGLCVGLAALLALSQLPVNHAARALPAGGAAGRPGAALRLVQADDHGVIVELDVEPVGDAAAFGAWLAGGAAGWGSRQPSVAAPGEAPPATWRIDADPGRPPLPELSLLVGVPPAAEPGLRILSDEAITLDGQVDLPPSPALAPAPGADGDGAPLAIAAPPDPSVYARAGAYPRSAASITDDAWLRDQRILRVSLHPFQVDPARRSVVLHRRLRVALTFADAADEDAADIDAADVDAADVDAATEGSASSAEAGRPSRPDQPSPFEPALRALLVNYAQARHWRGTPPAAALVASSQDHAAVDGAAGDGAGRQRLSERDQADGKGTRYRISVDRDGMVRVGYAELKAAGMPVDEVDPRRFALSSQGQTVAIEVAGEGDGRFDPGDALVFYGQRFRGQPETIDVAGNVFPGIVTEGKYTDTKVYWLATSGPPGPRMAVVDASPSDRLASAKDFPAVARYDLSRYWWSYHWMSDDTWFGDRLNITKPVTRSYPLELPGLAVQDANATVRAQFAARRENPASAPDHHVRLAVNADRAPAGEALWDGVRGTLFFADLPLSALREGENSVHLSVLLTPAMKADDVYLDWIEIGYPRRFEAISNTLAFGLPVGERRQYAVGGFADPAVGVYDLSEATRPVRLSGLRVKPAGGGQRAEFEAAGRAGAPFVAVSAAGMQAAQAVSRVDPPAVDWRDPEHGADYLILTHPDFRAAAERLAAHRSAGGLRVAVIDVDSAFFDAFSEGIYTPRAIHALLAWAYAHWQPPAPAYALLIGDGHFNLKHFPGEFPNSPPITMPPNLEFVDPFQGEVDSSNRLATVVGDDILPDLAIGRLPVSSAAEAEAVVDKIIAYEQGGGKAWGKRHLFIADDVPDPAGDFVAMSERLIGDSLPPGAVADRIYFDDYLDRLCADGAACAEGIAATRAAITRTLNVTGALLVNYIGHGSVERWTHQSIFTKADAAALDNGDRLPVVFSWTCLDGFWNHPTWTSVAESLLRAPAGGAVSVFSPTGLGVATGHDVLAEGTYAALFEDGARLGPATVAGKLALFTSSSVYFRSLIDTYQVIGDPALDLSGPQQAVEPPGRAYLPRLNRCDGCPAAAATGARRDAWSPR